MSEPAVSLGFFDPAQDLHGSVRAGVALLFEGASARALEGEPAIERADDGYRAVCGDEVDLTFRPFSAAAELGGASAQVAGVEGRVAGRELDCLGTVGETREAPRWAELDAVRVISAVFDRESALLLVARRPRGAAGHGQELVVAHLVSGGELLAVEDARVSTVYDAHGRQRSVGLELWLPGEDFPRRAAGEVAGGTTLELTGLRVNASVFGWRMEGRDGAGAYEVTVRAEPAEAA